MKTKLLEYERPLADERPWTPYRPLSRQELFTRFETDDSSSKHLLVLYSLAIGLQAEVIVDFGLGQTTGALRAAAEKTGATVFTCDFDRRRFESILSEQTDRWKLFLEPSSTFIPKLPQPVDLVMHDGAHDYLTVRRDLEAILPKMKKFGLICVHDTQQPDLHREMLGAIRDATQQAKTSVVNLPFGAGLAIIRIESSSHQAITPSTGLLPDGRKETLPVEFVTRPVADQIQISASRSRMVAAKIKIGHLLRQAGWRS